MAGCLQPIYLNYGLASVGKALMEKCLNCGANDYIIKPFESADLVAKIKMWLKKK